MRTAWVWYGLFVAGLVGLALFLTSFPSFPTGFAILETSDQNGFDAGTYENVEYNGTALVLTEGNLSGSYTSAVLSADSIARWNNVSWVGEGTLAFFVRSCDDSSCTDDAWSQILLSSPEALSVVNRTYFQYSILFERASLTEAPAVYSILIDYTPYNMAPVVTLEHPQEGATYNYNESVPLNFSVVDDDVDACWYSLDEGVTNVSLPTCADSSFSVPFDSYMLSLYVNDSNGSVSSASASFILTPDAPLLYLSSPPDLFATNASEGSFTYYVSDPELDQCDLLSDFSGSWSSSAVNDTLQDGSSSFDVEFDQTGERIWGIECSDLSGFSSASSNRTIVIDNAAPAITLSQPSGTYSSKRNIPIGLSVEDGSSVTCIYSLTKVGVGTVLVVVMPQCASTSFNVAQEGSYQLSVTVSDSAGNTGVASSPFSVSFSSSGGDDGGSGGGGGGGVSVNIQDLIVPKLEAANVPSIRLRAGLNESYTIDLVNKGNKFLNNCTLEGADGYASWVASSDSYSLGAGQHASYRFSLLLPRDLPAGDVPLTLKARCAEVTTSIPVPLYVIPAEFAFSVASYTRQGNELFINYTLEDLTGVGSSPELRYELFNDQSISVSEGSIVLSASSAPVVDSFIVPLPKDAIGSFSLVLDLSTSNDQLRITHPVFLSGSSVSGLVISGENRRTLLLWILVLVVGMGAFFIIHFLRRRYARSQKSS